MIELTKTLFSLGHPSAKAIGVTREKLENAVETFDLDYLKPPIHTGHPAADMTSPSLGYIKAVRLDGEKLVGDISVTESVKDDYEAGRLSAHSIEFYRDLDGRGFSIRGLGLLGATPPRQKALPGLFSFSESKDDRGEFTTVTFSEDIGDPTMPDTTTAPQPQGTQYSPADIAAIKAEAAATAVEAAQAKFKKGEEFAELAKDKEALTLDNERLAKEVEAHEAKTEADKALQFAETAAKENKLSPYKQEIIRSLVSRESAGDTKPGQKVIVFAEDKSQKDIEFGEALIELAKDEGEAITSKLSRPIAGAEKATGTPGGEVTVENFAEMDPTPGTLAKAVTAYRKANEKSTDSDAYIWLAENHGDWYHKASQPVTD